MLLDFFKALRLVEGCKCARGGTQACTGRRVQHGISSGDALAIDMVFSTRCPTK
jgi:hypothetical protein